MLTSNAPRPTFLVPSLLSVTGNSPPVESNYVDVPSLLRDLVPDSRIAAQWWDAFDPLILVLNLAGYECPEIAIGRWDIPDQYLRLLAWRNHVQGAMANVITGTGDWKLMFPPISDDSGKLRIGLRVEARRWLEKPIGVASPYPAISLSGIQGYATGSGAPGVSPNIWATDNDGWITLLQPHSGLGPTNTTKTLASETRDSVATKLADGWAATGGGAVGLVTALDPNHWVLPLGHALPLKEFSKAAADIWSWLADVGNLRTVLKAPLRGDPKKGVSDAATDRIFSKAKPGAQSPWSQAKRELVARHRLLHPREVNGSDLINGLENQHWIAFIFALHEFGLIRVLSPSITDPAALPDKAVVDDLPQTDITGLYETTWGETDGEGRLLNATIQINHAGDSIDGWLTDRDLFRYEFYASLDRSTYQPSSGIDMPLIKFKGVFDHDPEAWIEIDDVPHRDDGENFTSISVGFNTGSMHGEYIVTRVDRLPRLRPSLAMQALPLEVINSIREAPLAEGLPPWANHFTVLQSRMTPLHTFYRTTFESVKGRLLADLHVYFEDKNRSRTRDEAPFNPAVTRETDVRLRTILSHAGILTGSSIPNPKPPVLFRLQTELKEALASVVLSIAITYGNFLDELLFDLAQSGSDAGIGLQELLDLEPGALNDMIDDPSKLMELHVYTYQFFGGGLGGDVGGGAGLSAGMFGIQCGIDHHDECAVEGSQHRHSWSENYHGVMFEGALGASAGAQVAVNLATISDPNDVITRGEWSQDHFAPSTIVSGAATISLSDYLGVGGEVVPGSEKFQEKLGLGLSGSQYEWVSFVSGKGWAISEISPNDGWAVKMGVGIGGAASANLGTSLGYLLRRATRSEDRPIIVQTFEQAFPAETSLELQDFAIGSSTLSEGMRALLMHTVARYLALLGSPEVVIRIEGDASTTGSATENEILSWRRALAACAWIQTILSAAKKPDIGATTNFAASSDHIQVIGHGEEQARSALQETGEGQFIDNVEDARWRRVKILINDQIIIFL